MALYVVNDLRERVMCFVAPISNIHVLYGGNNLSLQENVMLSGFEALGGKF